jgi:hypothetical protein
MSLLQELGARLRATSDELPTGLVTVAIERLRSATELLNWVRQSSVDPIGVPQLGNATEHAEHAAAALRVAQDAIAAYLAVIGLSGDPGAPPGRDWRAGLDDRADPAPPHPRRPRSWAPGGGNGSRSSPVRRPRPHRSGATATGPAPRTCCAGWPPMSVLGTGPSWAWICRR